MQCKPVVFTWLETQMLLIAANERVRVLMGARELVGEDLSERLARWKGITSKLEESHK